ncbi:MAG: hypothetical protein L0K43_07895 [Bifidobacterium crudilactis]|nr:hypothetical protein [Bifidobacterium crudilactis]
MDTDNVTKSHTSPPAGESGQSRSSSQQLLHEPLLDLSLLLDESFESRDQTIGFSKRRGDTSMLVSRRRESHLERLDAP